MDTAQLTALVQKSALLTEGERSYWLVTLPKMTPEQQQRLAEILAKAEGIPWQEQIAKYVTMLGSAVQPA